MKSYIKNLGLCLLAGAAAVSVTSCNESLNLEPITQPTPDMYYKTADQLGNYVNAYYNAHLVNPLSYYGKMFHQADYSDGLNRSDINTDIACIGGGSYSYFVDQQWQVGEAKVLQGYYGIVRIWNYFLQKAEDNKAAGVISGNEDLINNYIGEGYFFRALAYYRILAQYGDAPIITEVLEDNDDQLVEASKRAPRNEVARFILADLDKAYNMLYDRSHFNGQRVSKEAAALLKSRVALFEATFEKYHKGSGRVPGDQNWPGAAMSYNQGKTFNIDNEVKFFFEQAMTAAKLAVNGVALTENNKVANPEPGKISGFNPYFEMYSQGSLAGVPEVIFWKEYNASQNVKHNAPYRTVLGCNDGMTRAFVEGFLMEDGKPFYASESYKGDKTIDDVVANRDSRLGLFTWSESTVQVTDPTFGEDALGALRGVPAVNSALAESRPITGYQSRKYFCYDYAQTWHDQILGVNACPIFRTAEAMLNYIEACVESTGAVDGTADGYWKQLRRRAGVNEDYMIAVNNTDFSKELQLSAYSGSSNVSKLIFNVRRERVCETFNEGLRFADLIRWRSFDPLLTKKWIPEGVNFWDEMYKADRFFEEDENGNLVSNLIADGSTNATVSPKEVGKYLQPYAASQAETNLLRDGYSWHEAYYLMPLGVKDLTTGSVDRDAAKSNMYQNLYWPTEVGYCTK